MAPMIRIYRTGQLLSEAEGKPGETLHNHIVSAGVWIDAPCGGQGKCGKCLVRLGGAGTSVGAGGMGASVGVDAVAPVRACRTVIDGDADIYLPDIMDMDIVDAGSVRIEAAAKTPSRGDLGVAIDIGTTTVVAHLIDTATGKKIATASGVNAQRACGADVMTRIKYCVDNGHERLTGLIRDQITSLINQTCFVSGERASDIKYVSIAANTIMEHLAAGLSPVGMGTVPFTPVSLFGGEIPAWEAMPVSKTAQVFFLPAVSAFVGGDITSGILAADIEETQGPTIFIDIGTNGEIVMKYGDRYFCCATAAGPAFEGAEITMGMAAVSGAINHVKWENGLKYTVIGDRKPAGICGSGLLDALAVLLDTGAVDETGRLLDAGEIEHDVAGHIIKVDGSNAFCLTTIDNVYITARDIRKLQLAKSAIAAGIQTLLHHAGVAETDVSSFVLAGGFGSYLDQFSAARIGLFPTAFLSVVQTLGNTAGEGAAIALCSPAAREKLESIRNRCEYVELSTSPVFNEQFVDQMMFE